MRSQVRVAAIGGGVVGDSVLDPGHLERDALLAGTRTYSNVSDRLMRITAIAAFAAASLVDTGDLSATRNRTLQGARS